MQCFFLLYNLFVIEVFLLITSIDRTNYQRIYLDEGKQSMRRDERYSFICALQWGFHTPPSVSVEFAAR